MNHSGTWAALHTHSVLFFPRIKRSKYILQLIIHVKFDQKNVLKWVSLGDILEWYHKLMWLRPVLTQRAVGHIRARRRWKMGESALRSSIIHAQQFHIVTFRPLSSGVTQHHRCSVFMELLTFYLLLGWNVTDLHTTLEPKVKWHWRIGWGNGWVVCTHILAIQHHSCKCNYTACSFS